MNLIQDQNEKTLLQMRRSVTVIPDQVRDDNYQVPHLKEDALFTIHNAQCIIRTDVIAPVDDY